MKPISEHHAPDPVKTRENIEKLSVLISEARSLQSGLVAFGEFGLDYDRLHYCSKTIQLHSFAAQLDLSASIKPQLPLFLHSRAAHGDFISLLKAKFGDKLERLEAGGVVHSFTGTIEEARELMDLGLHIGVNGCSFKTEENCAVVKELDLNKIMLETDGPWCEVRPSHQGWKYLIDKKSTPETTSSSAAAGSLPAQPGNARVQSKSTKQQKKEPEIPERFKVVKKEKWVEGAMVKGRNEPWTIERVARIVAGIKGVEVEEVCQAAWNNTTKVFGIGKQ
jgi:TatD DNase family protein